MENEFIPLEKELNSKDLRIGNIVKDRRGNIKTIVCGWMIDEDDFHYGIPLDEQWLNKLGFYKTYNGDKGDGIGCYRFDKVEIALSHNGFYAFDAVGHLTKGLKYVHHLQNLIYILTGTELTIKD